MPGLLLRRSRFRWPRLAPHAGLRMRATIGFGVTGLLVALAMALITFGLAKSYLVDQRESAAERQAYVNARLARAVLRTPDPDVPALLGSLGGGTASSSVVNYRGEWFSTTVASGSGDIPHDLQAVAADGRAGHQRFRSEEGDLRLAVGVPIAAADATYFELFALDELERTLTLLARALVLGVVGATIVAAVVGRTAAGRLVRPLGPIADAAEQIAAGELDTRLTGIDDPDVRRLAEAFNSMASSLEGRIEREARFAADVSHELRSPLTAVAASLEIIGRRRDQLPPQVTEAFNVLVEKVAMFQRMVLDLLEISQVDAGTATLADDVIDLRHLLPRLLARHDRPDVPVTIADGAPTHLVGDRRRLAQALGNIIDNAGHYAGGTTAIGVDAGPPGRVLLILDDEGPGVPAEERAAIFGRFARGQAGVGAGTSSGTGLGLSLAAEHLRLHQGTVRVEDNPAGGARFVVDLPVGEL